VPGQGAADEVEDVGQGRQRVQAVFTKFGEASFFHGPADRYPARGQLWLYQGESGPVLTNGTEVGTGFSGMT